MSHRALVPAEREGTGHNGESQSKGMRRKRGARPERKETLHPQALPGVAVGTEGRLAADTNIGGRLPSGSPGAPSHPTGTGGGNWELVENLSSQAAGTAGSGVDVLWKQGGGGG